MPTTELERPRPADDTGARPTPRRAELLPRSLPALVAFAAAGALLVLAVIGS